jgi:hypothetical protein
MKGAIITRELADGTKRYDALWRANGKQKQKTFKRQHDAEKYLTDTVKKVNDNTYRDVKPAPMGRLWTG